MTRREAGLDRKDSTLMNWITHWIMNHSNAKGVRPPPRRHAAKNVQCQHSLQLMTENQCYNFIQF